jgi:hypothetical protein
MRKLILGVSLYWPMVIGFLSGFLIDGIVMGRFTGWMEMLGLMFGCGLMYLWVPYFRKTRFGIVVRHHDHFGCGPIDHQSPTQ